MKSKIEMLMMSLWGLIPMKKARPATAKTTMAVLIALSFFVDAVTGSIPPLTRSDNVQVEKDHRHHHPELVQQLMTSTNVAIRVVKKFQRNSNHAVVNGLTVTTMMVLTIVTRIHY